MFGGANGCCSPLPHLAGELLRVTHLSRGVDEANALLLESVISGSMPESISKATVLPQVLAMPIIPVGP